MVSELIMKCRSYRRFVEKKHISDRMLRIFIENASLTPSGSNLQPLKYKIINNKKDNEELFKSLKWAGYLKDWKGPEEGERPAAYIIILGDKTISKTFSVDLGISAYALALSAAEKDIGSCMIGSIDRDVVRNHFDIPERFDILLVIAFGIPAETVIIEKSLSGNMRYYRDEAQIHHVPKRDIDEVIIY